MKIFQYRTTDDRSDEENENVPRIVIGLQIIGGFIPKNAIYNATYDNDKKTKFTVDYFDKGKQSSSIKEYDNYVISIVQQIFFNRAIIYIKKIEKNKLIEGITIHKYLKLT